MTEEIPPNPQNLESKQYLRGMGYRKDPKDVRDKTYKAVRSLSALPQVFSLQEKQSPVRDQGYLGSCHDPKTEVLTFKGWKKFEDITKEDLLASVNPITSELIFEKPTRIIKKMYKGDMYKTEGRSLNFNVTADHKMLIRKWDQSKRTLRDNYELVEAKDLGWYSGLMNRVKWNGSDTKEFYTLPGFSDAYHEVQRDDRKIDMKAWLRFLGIFLAEGTLLKSYKSGDYKIQIAAVKSREKDFIRELLQEMGIIALELKDRFTFTNRRVYEELSKLDLFGVRAPQKFVPQFVFEQSGAMISEFLLGFFMGDGSEQNGLKSLYTSSFQLAEDLQTLAFLSGNESGISIREARTSMTADGREITGNYPEHRVSICERKNLSLERRNITVEFYEGMVYCAEVPTYHTLVTRREGKILISGNCTGMATAAGVEYLRRTDGTRWKTLYSPLQIYYDAREMEGYAHEDTGAFIRDAIKAVNKNGATPESYWPYYEIQTLFSVKPTPRAYKAASRWKLGSYYRCDGLLPTLDAIANGFPVVGGFTCYSSMNSWTVWDTGLIPMPGKNDVIEGGHAVLFVGYDIPSRTVLFKNSWGTDWGQAGYGRLPFGYLESPSLASDFWAMAKESDLTWEHRPRD